MADSNAEELIRDGIAARVAGDFAKAITLFTSVIVNSGASESLRATALVNRAQSNEDVGDYRAAIVDLSQVVEMVDLPPPQRARAICRRGKLRELIGDLAEAITDYNSVLEIDESPLPLKAEALSHRSKVKEKLGDYKGFAADLMELGRTKVKDKDFLGAIEAFTEVFEMVSLPLSTRIEALEERLDTRDISGDRAGAFLDLDRLKSIKRENNVVWKLIRGLLGK